MAGLSGFYLRGWLVFALLLLAACSASTKPDLDHLIHLQQRADQAYAHGDMPSALSDYQSLTRILPAQSAYWFRLGNVQFRLGHATEAVAAYAHAVQRNPGLTEAWYNLGIVQLHLAQNAFAQAAQAGKSGDLLREQGAHMAHAVLELAPSSGTHPLIPAQVAEPASSPNRATPRPVRL